MLKIHNIFIHKWTYISNVSNINVHCISSIYWGNWITSNKIDYICVKILNGLWQHGGSQSGSILCPQAIRYCALRPFDTSCLPWIPLMASPGCTLIKKVVPLKSRSRGQDLIKSRSFGTILTYAHWPMKCLHTRGNWPYLCGVQTASGYAIFDTGHSIFDTGHSILNTGHSIFRQRPFDFLHRLFDIYRPDLFDMLKKTE